MQFQDCSDTPCPRGGFQFLRYLNRSKYDVTLVRFINTCPRVVLRKLVYPVQQGLSIVRRRRRRKLLTLTSPMKDDDRFQRMCHRSRFRRAITSSSPHSCHRQPLAHWNFAVSSNPFEHYRTYTTIKLIAMRSITNRIKFIAEIFSMRRKSSLSTTTISYVVKARNPIHSTYLVSSSMRSFSSSSPMHVRSVIALWNYSSAPRIDLYRTKNDRH